MIELGLESTRPRQKRHLYTITEHKLHKTAAKRPIILILKLLFWQIAFPLKNQIHSNNCFADSIQIKLKAETYRNQ